MASTNPTGGPLMKKLFSILLAIFILALAPLAMAAPSKSFTQAKEIALKGQKDIQGDFSVTTKVTKDGKMYTFYIAYLPIDKLIGGMVSSGNRKLAVVYNEEADKYFAALFENMEIMDQQELTADQADKFMEEILKNIQKSGIPV
jgi:hypothetical protein